MFTRVFLLVVIAISVSAQFGPCAGNPCPQGLRCEAEPKQCFTTPCFQYKCVSAGASGMPVQVTTPFPTPFPANNLQFWGTPQGTPTMFPSNNLQWWGNQQQQVCQNDYMFCGGSVLFRDPRLGCQFPFCQFNQGNIPWATFSPTASPVMPDPSASPTGGFDGAPRPDPINPRFPSPSDEPLEVDENQTDDEVTAAPTEAPTDGFAGVPDTVAPTLSPTGFVGVPVIVATEPPATRAPVAVTSAPTTSAPTTSTSAPTTAAPTTAAPTDAPTGSPTTSAPTQAPTPTAAPTTPFCANGIPSFFSETPLCCALSCGTCGGSRCGTRPGGIYKCCNSGIVRRGKVCTDINEDGCLIPVPTAAPAFAGAPGDIVGTPVETTSAPTAFTFATASPTFPVITNTGNQIWWNNGVNFPFLPTTTAPVWTNGWGSGCPQGTLICPDGTRLTRDITNNCQYPLCPSFSQPVTVGSSFSGTPFQGTPVVTTTNGTATGTATAAPTFNFGTGGFPTFFTAAPTTFSNQFSGYSYINGQWVWTGNSNNNQWVTGG